MGFGGFLKQSTAVDILIGPFVSATDGDTEMTALTISQADVRVSKNGQTAAQKNDVTACAADADGFYNCELDATDTDTVGQLTIYIHESTALAVRHDYQVIEEAIYDSLFGASAAGFDANQDVTVGSIAAGAITAAAIATDAIDADALADDAITSATFAAGSIGASALATTAVEEIADGVWDEARSGHVASGSYGEAVRDLYENVLRRNTAQAGGTNTITLDASASATSDLYNNNTRVIIVSGTGVGQCRLVTDYDGSTKVATVAPDWVTNPDNTSVFQLIPWSGVDIWRWRSGAPNALATGRVDASVGEVAAGAITAAAIATGAIDADAIATDAVTEINAGIFTTQMTEAYNTDGTAPTLAQALFVIMQRLTEFSISGTTITVKKLDGNSTAMTLTMDHAIAPTSSTRSS